MKDSIRQFLFILLFIFILIPCIVNLNSCQKESLIPTNNTNETFIDSLFESFNEFKFQTNPLEASKSGEKKYNNRLVNYISDEHQVYLKDRYLEFITAIERVDTELLSPTDRISLSVMEWDCRIKLEGLYNKITTIASPIYDLPTFELMPVSQISSLQLYFSQIAAGQSVHPFKTPEDYRDWLERIDDYLLWLDTAIEKMQEGIENEIVLPKVLIERVSVQLDPFIKAPIEEHIFYNPIKLMPDYFTTIDREPLRDAYRQMITQKLIVKYQQLQNFIITDYLPAGRSTSGIGALPGGNETYNYLIRLHTSTDMSPEEIFQLGKTEVERISKEMIKIKNQLGYPGDLKTFLAQVRTNPDLMPFSHPEEVIEHFNDIYERMKPKLLELFDVAPKAGFEIRRTEEFREQSASAEYVPGSKDGSRPGTFYIPIPDVKTHNILTDEALFLHEAIPGHHFQLSLQQENQKLPKFLHPESMGVFVEGWALYAESLGRELGLYQDPYQYFGMLSMEMHRAIRLVVDTGIHAKGWTREDAIKYSLDHEADSMASISSEIERYMATPGQALSYKIGQLKIRELRTLAETALGDAFKIKEFHNQILNSGSLPMGLLEDKIKTWIQIQKIL